MDELHFFPVNRPLRPVVGVRRKYGLLVMLAFVPAIGAHVAVAEGIAAQAANGVAVTAVSATPTTNVKAHHNPREKTYLKRTWGVEVMFVRETAGGHMLEFRYKVLDADKARPLFERQTKPLLTHVESGLKLTVPEPATVGPLRNSNPPLAGHAYWMFFGNPGMLVKPGDHVNIAIGGFHAEGLVVRQDL